MSCLSTYVLFLQSPAVIILYHTYSWLDVDYCLSTYSCMLVLMTQFSMLVHDLDLSIHLCSSMLAIWLSHHHSPGSSDSSGSSCPGFGAWSVWTPSVADQIGAVVAWIPSRPFRAPSFQAPMLGSRVFLLWLWASFCTIHTCTIRYILALAPYWWCNIIVILGHFLW